MGCSHSGVQVRKSGVERIGTSIEGFVANAVLPLDCFAVQDDFRTKTDEQFLDEVLATGLPSLAISRVRLTSLEVAPNAPAHGSLQDSQLRMNLRFFGGLLFPPEAHWLGCDSLLPSVSKLHPEVFVIKIEVWCTMQFDDLLHSLRLDCRRMLLVEGDPVTDSWLDTASVSSSLQMALNARLLSASCTDDRVSEKSSSDSVFG
eukprot:CAMPEP_0171099254 /NCGR_PEP_ID=MMETSP0766_2-20121228/50955_1 /TAXON_ID=439317 /ORGANISM="Gambierdiscus australes, Strain CAWD 149" /LENGTH=202 /DNA_ID=CAMNT_0011558833 /DNA_START=22 /DNA_END=630 /DNA_ORIENTATION=-